MDAAFAVALLLLPIIIYLIRTPYKFSHEGLAPVMGTYIVGFSLLVGFSKWALPASFWWLLPVVVWGGLSALAWQTTELEREQREKKRTPRAEVPAKPKNDALLQAKPASIERKLVADYSTVLEPHPERVERRFVKPILWLSLFLIVPFVALCSTPSNQTTNAPVPVQDPSAVTLWADVGGYVRSYKLPPLQSDDETHLEAVEGTGKQITFKYATTPVGEQIMQRGADREYIQEGMRSLACAKQDLSALINQGAEVIYQLRRSNGEIISTLISCGNK